MSREPATFCANSWPHLLPPALSPAQVNPELLQEGHRRLVQQQRAQPGRLHPPHDGALAARQLEAHNQQRRLLWRLAVPALDRRRAALHFPGALPTLLAARERPDRCHTLRPAQEECSSHAGGPWFTAHSFQCPVSQYEWIECLH